MASRGRKQLPVNDGWVLCPKCSAQGYNVRIKHIAPDTVNLNDLTFCRRCKTEFKLDILGGQCFFSQSP